jgi:XTP/dITP diphosphohydrolase
MEKLLIATKNPGKFAEIKAILGDIPYEIVSISDLGIDGDIDEDGVSYEENALKKAKFFYKKSGVLTLADDSGIEVFALKGELGLKTRRWGVGESASDEEWVEHFLQRMKGVDDRRARFLCCVAVVGDGFKEVFFGEAKGVITEKLEAPIWHGLPISSCFRPDGLDRVYAALGQEEKGRISHRGKAVGMAKRGLKRGPSELVKRGVRIRIEKKIREIEEESGIGNKYWICGRDTGRFLYENVLKEKPKVVLEFGTSIGYSALWIAKALMEIGEGGRLFTVESHKERGDFAAKNFEEVGIESVVTLVRGHAPEVVTADKVLEGLIFDMAFFDSTKYEHLSYFDAVYPRLKKGGVIIVDNVISHGEGNMMRKFIDMMMSHHAMKSEIINIGDGVLLAQKRL